MIDIPQIIDISAARHTAMLHVRCTREELSCALGRGVRELLDRIQAQGAQATGPLFTHHLRRPTDSFDFEIGVPVDRPVDPKGRVYPGQWPAMRVVRTLYRGRYEELPQAWGALLAWIAAQGLVASGELWECYLSGPETGSDPSAWRTELNQPLCGDRR